MRLLTRTWTSFSHVVGNFLWKTSDNPSPTAKVVVSSKCQQPIFFVEHHHGENNLSECHWLFAGNGANPGIGERGIGPCRSLPLPFFSLFPLSFPFRSLRSRAPRGYGECCKLRQRGPGRSPGLKRFWCTLKLPESHWWQSFRILWLPCFTVERSTFSVS